MVTLPQHASSDRTPFARMLPSVIGSMGLLKRVMQKKNPAFAGQLDAGSRHAVWMPRGGHENKVGCYCDRRSCFYDK
jgi:hypothetical protein